jgi:hypothetical protein
MTQKTKPAAEVKQGLITGTIWKNSTEKSTRYSVTFSRLYKKDDQWKRTASFGPDDLLTLAQVVGLAHGRIFQLSQPE